MVSLNEHSRSNTLTDNGQNRNTVLPNGSTVLEDVSQRAFKLGIVAGLRSMMPLALLLWTRESDTKGSGLIDSQAARYVTGLAALAEVIGDKLPILPSRIRPGPLAARLAVGGLVGALLNHRYKQPALPGAINGMLGAGVGTCTGYAARFFFSHVLNLPDALWAGLEDAIALRLGMRALSRDHRE